MDALVAVPISVVWIIKRVQRSPILRQYLLVWESWEYRDADKSRNLRSSFLPWIIILLTTTYNEKIQDNNKVKLSSTYPFKIDM